MKNRNPIHTTNAMQQLELGLNRTSPIRRHDRRERRAARAEWWFEQMHRVVDAAIDWRPTPPARPQQDYLRLISASVNHPGRC